MPEHNTTPETEYGVESLEIPGAGTFRITAFTDRANTLYVTLTRDDGSLGNETELYEHREERDGL